MTDNYIAIAISFGIPIAIVLIAAVIVVAIQKSRRHLSELLKLKLVSIRLAQKSETEKKDNIAEISLSSQLFSLLSNLKIPFSLETAVHNIGEDIHFYIAVPESSVDFTIRQIQGLWSEAQVQRADDYTVFNSEGAVRAA